MKARQALTAVGNRRILRMKALLVLFVCTMAVAVGIFLIGSSLCNQPPIEASETSKTENTCSTIDDVFKAGLSDAWDFVHDHHDELIAIGMLFIVIFAIVLVFFTISLARATKKLIVKAENTERRKLRAYVGLDKLSFEFDGLQAENNTPADLTKSGIIHKDFIVVKVRNYGLTPAYGVTVYVYVTYTNFPARLADNFFQKKETDPISAVHPTLARFLSIRQQRFLLNKDQIQLYKIVLGDITLLKEALEKKNQAYVFGRIYYRDIYDRPWRTKFCYAWEPWHPSGERFVPYEEHNEEDQVELAH
jgi:hypothetical protein